MQQPLLMENQSGPRIAVLLHLATMQNVDEFYTSLSNISAGFDLYVNLVSGFNSESVILQQQSAILQRYPGATIIVSDNRGMDIGGMFRLFKYSLGGNYDCILYAHSKSDDLWRRGMLDVLSRQSDRAIRLLSRQHEPSGEAPYGMLGAYLYPFDYYNAAPFLQILEQLDIPVRTTWNRYFEQFPSASSLAIEQRIMHARDMNRPELRPEVDLEYAEHILGNPLGDKQVMSDQMTARFSLDKVLGPLPYFPGNFFWLSGDLIRQMAQKLDFDEEFSNLPENLTSDKTLQSRAHAWERALPVFVLKSGCKLATLEN